MFLLDELPDRATMVRFAKRYPDMDIDGTAACLRLLKAASVLIRDLEQYFSAHDLSLARFLALIVLEREPGQALQPAQIARKMGIARKNALRLLGFMEDNALITRADHQTDGRASLVTITAQGRRRLASLLPGYFKLINRTMRPLDGASRQALADILDQLL